MELFCIAYQPKRNSRKYRNKSLSCSLPSSLPNIKDTLAQPMTHTTTQEQDSRCPTFRTRVVGLRVFYGCLFVLESAEIQSAILGTVNTYS